MHLFQLLSLDRQAAVAAVSPLQAVQRLQFSPPFHRRQPQLVALFLVLLLVQCPIPPRHPARQQPLTEAEVLRTTV